MRANLSGCLGSLGLIDNGQHKSTNRILVLVPHDRPHGIMRIPENLCMLLPKALKMRAFKHTMALIANSIGGTKCAPAQMPWHLRHLNPALLNRQGMSTRAGQPRPIPRAWRERERFTTSIQPAMAYEDESVLMSRPLYRWPI